MTVPHTRRGRTAFGALTATVLATTVLAATVIGGPAAAAPATGVIASAGDATVVPDSFIVVLKDSTVGGRAGTRAAEVTAVAGRLADRYAGRVERVYGHALNGFQARMPESAAKRLAADPAVAYVERDRLTELAATQTNPPWNLDRIDQPTLPYSNSYTWVSPGTGVRIYVIDTGINQGHQDFAGQAVYGYDAIDGTAPANDCIGHGTHAAGVAGGNAYGVAKNAVLVNVKVFDCVVPSTLSIVIAGINWVTANHPPGLPAVANLGVQTAVSAALNAAVTTSISSGVLYSVPAGNNNANACNYSPASVPNALTVGATTNTDARASWSNFGSCLDLFAPGANIISAWWTAANATAAQNGTSNAAPHVAGAAARVWSVNPTWTPLQVANYLTASAVPVVLNPGAGSPNRLLHVSPAL